jgi:acyl-CoA synthetase (AMP-forming)/AMP-acid ligase II
MSIQEIKHLTLVDSLRDRAKQQPDRIAYIFLKDGETKEETITYQQLDQQAKAIASQLTSLQSNNAPVILIYPYDQSLEFITAFFGCLYAGAIAIPCHPPQNLLAIKNLQGRLTSSQAKIILTTQKLLTKTKHQLDSEVSSQLFWLNTENIKSNEAVDYQIPQFTPDHLAFLQYTSGSTGIPKGVMVSHQNLISNQQMLQLAFAGNSQSIGVGWLPLFHDMGLIGNVLHSLYLGIPCVLMSPLAFIQKPIRWLQAISHYRGTISGGPNFAYDLLCRQVTEAQKQHLDLSSWELAFTGAEPIRQETIKQFSNYFADCGFRREAFYPCYGMAEATLFITGGLKNEAPIIKYVEEKALEQNRVVLSTTAKPGYRSVIGCGRAWLDEKIVIVDPQSLTLCLPHQVGEIWVAGSGVAQGYWQQQELTQQTFQAYLSDYPEQPFLRTGDLGFLDNQELFITGRLKDVMMFWGFTCYPHHLEQTVQQSHPAFSLNSGAAFSINIAGEEKLVIVQEIERSYRNCLDVDEVIETIRWRIFAEHFVDVYAIALLQPGSLPKTSSGKVKRSFCKEQYLNQNLKTISLWQSPSSKNDLTTVINRYLNPMTHLRRYSGLFRGKLRRFLYQIRNQDN